MGTSAAADYPRWVMLDRGERRQDASTADATTSASCYSSTGRTVQVSFHLAAPPALSTLHVDARLPGGEISGTRNGTYYALISAHRDSVLIELSSHCYGPAPSDYFVYNAGAGGGARPPRLLLLPPCGADMHVGRDITGILSRGGDEFLVASLVLRKASGRTEDPREASMCVLRSGECKWEQWSGIPVRHADGQEAELSCWLTGSVIAVGDRFLYWIDLARGIILSDVTTEIPELRYVPLPADPLLADTADGNGLDAEGSHDPRSSRNVCVTVAGVVRCVGVSPRCCCGGPGATSCARSRRAFTVTTWTLRTDDMTWKEDGVLDSGELWAAAEAAGIPLAPPAFPVVSMEDPDVVCFLLSEFIHRWRSLGDDSGDRTAWLVAVDMRRKTLRSVCRYPEDDGDRLLLLGRQAFLPSEVSSYFNTACHGCDNPMPASREVEEELELLAAIREIPGMARDEMLRAHSLLAGDDRRVRFLVALPVDMRKEYCMILTELERNRSVRAPTFLVLQFSGTDGTTCQLVPRTGNPRDSQEFFNV